MKDEERKIILKMNDEREAKQVILNKIVDLEGQIIKYKYDAAIIDTNLDKLYLKLGTERMKNK